SGALRPLGSFDDFVDLGSSSGAEVAKASPADQPLVLVEPRTQRENTRAIPRTEAQGLDDLAVLARDPKLQGFTRTSHGRRIGCSRLRPRLRNPIRRRQRWHVVDFTSFVNSARSSCAPQMASSLAEAV